MAFLALLTGFLFFRTRLHANSLYYGFLYFGALFYSIIHMMVNGLSELTLTVQRMGVFFKQVPPAALLCVHASLCHSGACRLLKDHLQYVPAHRQGISSPSMSAASRSRQPTCQARTEAYHRMLMLQLPC